MILAYLGRLLFGGGGAVEPSGIGEGVVSTITTLDDSMSEIVNVDISVMSATSPVSVILSAIDGSGAQPLSVFSFNRSVYSAIDTSGHGLISDIVSLGDFMSVITDEVDMESSIDASPKSVISAIISLGADISSIIDTTQIISTISGDGANVISGVSQLGLDLQSNIQ